MLVRLGRRLFFALEQKTQLLLLGGELCVGRLELLAHLLLLGERHLRVFELRDRLFILKSNSNVKAANNFFFF